MKELAAEIGQADNETNFSVAESDYKQAGIPIINKSEITSYEMPMEHEEYNLTMEQMQQLT